MPCSRIRSKVDRRILVRALAVLATGVSIYPHRASSSCSRHGRSSVELDPAVCPGRALRVAAFLCVGIAADRARDEQLVRRRHVAARVQRRSAGRARRERRGNCAAVQAFVRAGVPAVTTATGLAAAAAVTTAALLALPVVTLPTGAGGTALPNGLRAVAYIGGAAFVLLAILGIVALVSDRPVTLVGWPAPRPGGSGSANAWRISPSACSASATRSAPHSRRTRWRLLAAIGRGGASGVPRARVRARGARGRARLRRLVLLAHAAASLLGLIPLTPGGLGFVEAGPAARSCSPSTPARLVATLAFRLVSFWLPAARGDSRVLALPSPLRVGRARVREPERRRDLVVDRRHDEPPP